MVQIEQQNDSRDPAKDQSLLNDAQRLIGQARSEMEALKGKLAAAAGDMAAQGRIRDAMAAVGSVMTQLSAGIKNPATLDQATIEFAAGTLGAESAVATTATVTDGASASASELLNKNADAAFNDLREGNRRIMDEIFKDQVYAGRLDFDDPKKEKEFLELIQQMGTRAKKNEEMGTDEGEVRTAYDNKVMVHLLNGHLKHKTQADIDREKSVDAAYDFAVKRQRDKGNGQKVDEWLADEKQELSKIAKAKGYSDQVIDQEFSEHKDNPMAVARDLFDRNDPTLKAYWQDVRGDLEQTLNFKIDPVKKDGKLVDLTYQFTDDPASKPTSLWALNTTPTDVPVGVQVADASAALKAAGVLQSDTTNPTPDHGLSIKNPASSVSPGQGVLA